MTTTTTTKTTDDLQTFLSKKIYHWVGKNFGSQEADDPSWNIDELSKYLAQELDKRDGKNLKSYELSVLLKTDCDVSKAIDELEFLVYVHGGKNISIENEGTKRLAYKIHDNTHAVHIYIEAELPEDAPSSISSRLNLDDRVMRFLLVKANPRRR